MRPKNAPLRASRHQVDVSGRVPEEHCLGQSIATPTAVAPPIMRSDRPRMEPITLSECYP
jgi:hypothetical protein